MLLKKQKIKQKKAKQNKNSKNMYISFLY